MSQRGIFRLLGVLIVSLSAAPYANSQNQTKDLAGWHISYNDSLQGANIQNALDYLHSKGKKAKKKIVVGIIDSGADTLTTNINGAFWTNRKEKADGVDNDKNGYVDDIHGWNFLGTKDGTFNMTSAGTEEYRQFKRLYPKYKNVKDREEAVDKAEYDYYIRMRKKAGINGYIMFYKFNSQKMAAIHMMDSIMQRNRIPTDTLSFAGLFNVEVQDTLWNGLSQMLYTDLLRTKKTEKWADYKKAQEDNLHLMRQRIEGIEKDRDKRLLMGDNLEDADDIYYGNNTLTVDGCDHGTFVAGVVGGNGGGDPRYAGVANGVAQLMIVRACPDGDEYDKDVATAIRYAVDNGAKVINISFGKSQSPTPEMVNNAIAYAAKKDVLIINAAGNNSQNIDSVAYYPTGRDAAGHAYPNFMRVGSSDVKGVCSKFSNYGAANVDVLAPGEYISSAFPGDKYDMSQGTSVAAPVVSGVAALLRAYFPKLKAAEIKQLLMRTVRKTGQDDKCVSGGCIDMLNAVKDLLK